MELTNEFRVSVPVEDAWNVLTDVERIAPCLPGAQLQEIEGDEYRGIVKVKVGPITAQYKGKATFKSRDDVDHVAVLKAEGRDTRGQGNASALITATLTPDGDGTQVVVHTNLTITGKVAQFGRGVLVDVSGKLLTQFVECLEHDLLSGVPAASSAAAANGAAKAVAPVEKSAPEPIEAPAKAKPAAVTPPRPAAAATPKTPEPVTAKAPSAATAPPKVDAPVEKSTPEPVPAAPRSATPPHGDPVAATSASTAATTETKTAAAETSTPAHGDAVTEPKPTDAPTVRRIEHKTAEPVDLLDAAGVPVAKRAIPVVAGVLVILWFLRRRRQRRR